MTRVVALASLRAHGTALAVLTCNTKERTCDVLRSFYRASCLCRPPLRNKRGAAPWESDLRRPECQRPLPELRLRVSARCRPARSTPAGPPSTATKRQRRDWDPCSTRIRAANVTPCRRLAAVATTTGT